MGARLSDSVQLWGLHALMPRLVFSRGSRDNRFDPTSHLPSCILCAQEEANYPLKAGPMKGGMLHDCCMMHAKPHAVTSLPGLVKAGERKRKIATPIDVPTSTPTRTASSAISADCRDGCFLLARSSMIRAFVPGRLSA